MSDVQVFKYQGLQEIRAIIYNGDPLVVGKDIASGLGHANPQRAVRDHVPAAHRRVTDSVTPYHLGLDPKTVLITEAGLYRLIMRSNTPEAEAFQEWVTAEVLPTIRKTGSYTLPSEYQERLAIAEPKAQLQTRFEDKRTGYTGADMGAMFGKKPMEFHALMRAWGITYYNEAGKLCASLQWIRKGWMRLRGGSIPVFSPEGIEELGRRLNRKGIA